MKEVKLKTFRETIKELKCIAKIERLKRGEELDTGYTSEVEFMLSYRGWYLLCHINKTPPYVIRYRLIGTRQYKKVEPKGFIEAAKKELLH